MNNSSIQLKNVIQLYNRRHLGSKSSDKRFSALNGITIEFIEGSLSLLMGQTGSGKTTLLNILSTKLIPTSGKLLIIEKEPASLNDYDLQNLRKKIGYLKQNLKLNYFENLTLKSYIDLLIKYKICEQNILNEVYTLLEKLGLSERHLNQPIKNFSSGEKQRVSFLLVVIKNPQIMLLDEPTSFLDFKSKERMFEILKELSKLNKTIIIASHDQFFIDKAHQIYFLEHGLITKEGLYQYFSTAFNKRLDFSKITLKNDFLVEIPITLFQQLGINKIFVNEKVGENKFLFKEINEKLFNENEYDKWIYITNQFFQLPEKFRNPNLINLNYFWEVSNGNYYIIFDSI
jgi:putative ABC transport system ATP-binding protein